MNQSCLKSNCENSTADPLGDTPELESVLQLWQQFQSASNHFPGSIVDSIHFDFQKHSKHIVVLTLIHGNEIGSLPAVMGCVNALKNGELKFGGKITFILGNREAFHANVRFIHDDLNRMFFDFDNITSSEKKRAAEIASIIDTADFLLDLHQTIGTTPHPFYVCKDRPANHQWAQALEASQHVIISDPNRFISEGLVSAIEYADTRNIPALVIELSQLGICKDAQRIADECIRELLTLTDLIESKQTNLSEVNTHTPQPSLLRISEHVRFDSRKKRLLPGLNNLQFVTAGTQIGYNEDDSALTMPQNGYLLFPKYPPRNSTHEVVGTVPSSLVEIVIPI